MNFPTSFCLPCFRNDLKFKRLSWSIISCFITFILDNADDVFATQSEILMIPPSYTALSSDIHVQLKLNEPVITNKSRHLSLQINKISNEGKENVWNINIDPDPRYNITQIKIPCQTLFLGGTYEFEVIKIVDDEILADSQDDNQLKQILDVRWPIPHLNVSIEQIGTYPEKPVNVILSFPEIACVVDDINNPKLPEFWLELVYCGREFLCKGLNETRSHVVYAVQIRGFVKTKTIELRCELFGLAGHYMIQLRPVKPTPSFVSAFTYIRADWNEKFVFNVHAHSIFPCDVHNGVKVLFEYPSCILDQVDRVRLFAKLRADVASLKPPTSLYYVTEQRVQKGQHVLHFDCDYFSEKYVEYCFVYVSQAISGAVADIRMDCVPTLPVRDADTGGWSPWSEWTPCSSKCARGTRNRYRFCDSPPPRYGAQFCKGPAVETEYCENSNLWKCFDEETSISEQRFNHSNADIEMGTTCRCGCIVHLGVHKPKRVLLYSAHSCPGRSLWLIQADEKYKIKLQVNFSRLPCPTQYVKIRDGDSLASNLIFQNNGGAKSSLESITSSINKILIEIFSDETASVDGLCNGGFIAHVEQIVSEKQENALLNYKTVAERSHFRIRINVVQIAAVLFICIIIVLSILLGLQYVFCFRKYHLTIIKREPDSPTYTPRTSVGSLHNLELSPSRAVSTSTLLSEVIYFVKLKPQKRTKHYILEEGLQSEILENESNLDIDMKKEKSEDLDNVSEGNNKNQNKIYKNESLDSVSYNSKQSDTNSVSLIKHENKIKETLSDTGHDAATPDTEINESADDENFFDASDVTFIKGCYSPAASIVSIATIRNTNQKESKEKINRERHARPGSDFSLANPEDLELDYYDYNVINAAAVPGSYLGMDPAYLVWIPPLDNGNIINEIQISNESHFDGMLPQPDNKDLDSGSNTETPECENLNVPPMYFIEKESKDTNSLKSTLKLKVSTTSLHNFNTAHLKYQNSHSTLNKPKNETIQMKDFVAKCNKMDAIKKTYIKNSTYIEKETLLVKSSDNKKDYYELDDIHFVDEEEGTETNLDIKT